MNKNKKLLNLLSGLGGEVTVRDVREVRQKGGVTLIEIPVDHKIHSRPCDDCGSTYTKKHELLVFNACHIPQGKRQPCKVICKKQRFLCKSCGNTFVEDVPWLYRDAHITVPLAECITKDLHSIMTKNDIARVNCVSTMKFPPITPRTSGAMLGICFPRPASSSPSSEMTAMSISCH